MHPTDNTYFTNIVLSETREVRPRTLDVRMATHMIVLVGKKKNYFLRNVLNTSQALPVGNWLPYDVEALVRPFEAFMM